MKTKALHSLAITAIFLFALENARANVLTGPIVNPDNGHTYYLLDQSSWTDAQTQALLLGGNLATIRNASEESWVFGTFACYGDVNRSLWIGLNDASVEGTFVWVSGEPVTYTDWLPGQPDNNLSDAPENYVQIIALDNGFNVPANTWNDIGNSGAGFPQLGPIYGVVEVLPDSVIVPEPSAAALLCFGSMLSLPLFNVSVRRSGGLNRK